LSFLLKCMKVLMTKLLCVICDVKAVLATKITVVTLRVRRNNGSDCGVLWLILQEGAEPLRLGSSRRGLSG